MPTPRPTTDQPLCPSRLRLRAILHDRFRSRPAPLLAADHFAIPAASIWTGSRVWVAAFRELGLGPGDRVILALPQGPGFVMALIAALWEGLTLRVLPPLDDPTPHLLAADARLAIIPPHPHTHPHAHAHFEHTITPHGAGIPPEPSPALRVTARTPLGPATPGIALLLDSSGSSGSPRTVALSWANLSAQLDSHTPALGLTQADTALCILPWSHAFGLLVDLLPALLSGATVIPAPDAARDLDRLADTALRWDATHLCAVPRTIERLADHPRGPQVLGALRGGVVGGAPVTDATSALLARTRLRAGYGQTEASPGIALGLPGEWSPGWLGRPIACRSQIAPDGRLLIQGPNVCAGFWTPSGLVESAPDRWLDTGDLVEPHRDGLRFLGRADRRFKLANGRIVEAPSIERRLALSLPGDPELAVIPLGSDAIEIVIVARAASPLHAPSHLAPTLGPLADRLRSVRVLTPASAPRTPKGELDRAALIAAHPAAHPDTQHIAHHPAQRPTTLAA